MKAPTRQLFSNPTKYYSEIRFGSKTSTRKSTKIKSDISRAKSSHSLDIKFVVRSVNPNSQAEKLGINRGDIIAKIGKLDCAKMMRRYLRKRVRMLEGGIRL